MNLRAFTVASTAQSDLQGPVLELNRHGVLSLGCPEMPRHFQSELLLLDFGEIGSAGGKAVSWPVEAALHASLCGTGRLRVAMAHHRLQHDAIVLAIISPHASRFQAPLSHVSRQAFS